MKFFSSVKIVVEEGAKLTLDDSVSFAPIEVNGGTLSMKNNGSIVDSITLNDKSTLEDATITSRGGILTDGNYAVEVPRNVVTVNGEVTFKGENTIKGYPGDASSPGQNALLVNGTVKLADGSVLNAIGGGDPLVIYAIKGGNGVLLNNGKITGKGVLNATGGNGNELLGKGGAGIAGTGSVDVSEINAKGGDGFSRVSLSGHGKGGDSIEKTVNFTADKLTAVGGSGSTNGLSWKAVDKDTDTYNSGSKDDSKDNSNTSDSGKDSNKDASDSHGKDYTYLLTAAMLTEKSILNENVSPTASKDGSMTFAFDAPFDKLTGVSINGDALKNSDYTAVKGSTKITLSKELVSGLKEGSYELVATYSTGKESKARFTVLGKSQSDADGAKISYERKGNAPKTGDEFAVEGTIALMLSAAFIYRAIKESK